MNEMVQYTNNEISHQTVQCFKPNNGTLSDKVLSYVKELSILFLTLKITK